MQTKTESPALQAAVAALDEKTGGASNFGYSAVHRGDDEYVPPKSREAIAIEKHRETLAALSTMVLGR